VETNYYLLLRIGWETFERVRIKVLTNISQESFSDVFRHHPSNDSNTGAPDSFNALRRYSTSLNIREFQLRNDLLLLVRGLVLFSDNTMNLPTLAWKRLLQSGLSTPQQGHPKISESALRTRWSGYASIHGTAQAVVGSFCRRK